jgi:hypothetical protein
VGAIAQGADAVGLSAKMANSIGRSNALHKTDVPVEIEAIRNTAMRPACRNRHKMRARRHAHPSQWGVTDNQHTKRISAVTRRWPLRLRKNTWKYW